MIVVDTNIISYLYISEDRSEQSSPDCVPLHPGYGNYTTRRSSGSSVWLIFCWYTVLGFYNMAGLFCNGFDHYT